MSAKACGWVWDMDLPRDEKYLLLAYADHADHDGRGIYPSVDLLTRKTGYSKRSVQRITRQLEAAGLLLPDGKGPHGIRRWRIDLGHAGGAKLAPLGVTPVALEGCQIEREGVTPVALRGAIAMAPKPSLTVTKTEPSEEKQTHTCVSPPSVQGEMLERIKYAEAEGARNPVAYARSLPDNWRELARRRRDPDSEEARRRYVDGPYADFIEH